MQELTPIELRIIGALIEKELSTPDHYPLSLNSLVAACNQSSNRDPVMSLDEAAVSAGIDTLRRQGLVRSFQGSGERVPKYQHLLADTEEFSRAQLAVLCLLMLRGQQTLAELRTRAARLLPGDHVDGIEAALESLISREPMPAAARLPRRPGQKEVRYAHLLGGEPLLYEEKEDVRPVNPAADRLGALEAEVETLRAAQEQHAREITELRAQLEAFRRQFE